MAWGQWPSGQLEREGACLVDSQPYGGRFIADVQGVREETNKFKMLSRVNKATCSTYTEVFCSLEWERGIVLRSVGKARGMTRQTCR